MIKISLKENLIKPLYANSQRRNTCSLTTLLNRRITKHLDPSQKVKYDKSNDASIIVTNFLSKSFGATFATQPTDKKVNLVCEYLLRKDLDNIIMSFWRCVAAKWREKLSVVGILVSLTYEDILKLSKWSGVKQYIEKIPTADCNLRQQKISEAMPKSLKHFFVYDFGGKKETNILDYNQFIHTVANDNNVFKTVKFKYHTDLSTPEGKKKTSKIWGALDILSYIFDYVWLTNIKDTNNITLRHKILSNIAAPVCPYCNRQYITLYGEGTDNANDENQEDDRRTTADLDHFFIKSAYPYLALSVHNFVPSCQICNSRFKGTTDFHALPHLYPYGNMSGDEITFELNNPLLISDIKTWRDWDTEDNTEVSGTSKQIIKIKTANGNINAENSVRTFRLDEVYQSHADYVHEIVWKAIKYNDIRLAELVDMFPELFSSIEDAKEIIFSQYLNETELCKRPLSKLTRDILNYLEIKRNE